MWARGTDRACGGVRADNPGVCDSGCMNAALTTRNSSFSTAAAPGSALTCYMSAIGVLEAHGIARCGRAAPIGLVERSGRSISPCLRQQMHAALITRSSSFSAAAAPGSLQGCFRSASGVLEAHGIARCGRAAPIGLVERSGRSISPCLRQQMHAALITRSSSFSAAAALGSLQGCFRSASGVPEAHGIT